MNDLTSYLPDIKVENKDGKDHIWGQARRSWFILTPEEVVRQTCISHLLSLGYPIQHITAERQILYNKLRKRYDIAVSDKSGEIHILVECKEPETSLSDKSIRQIISYNLELSSRYLWVTNGHTHLFYFIDQSLKKAIPLDELPLVSH